MARNDAYLLAVPAPLAAVPMPEEVAEPTPAEPKAATPDSAALEPLAPAVELKARLAALTTCPHCRVRLSGIDLKMNRCFGCGKTLIVLDAPELDGAGQFTVRI